MSKGDYTRRYNFIQEIDQFGRNVDKHFYDRSEEILIEKFECIVLSVIDSNVEPSMIELGSNQAYYSCLFQAIARGKNPKSILVEPYDIFMPRSKRHFEINHFDGIFDNRSIGSTWFAWQNYKFVNGAVSVDDLLKENSIEKLSILHSDIDGSEVIMLESAHESLKLRKIDYVIILTHGDEYHQKCLNILQDLEYHIIEDINHIQIGGDHLIIAKNPLLK